MEKRLQKSLYILGGLIVALVIVIVLLHAKACGSDEACFNKYAQSCKKVSSTVVTQSNIFLYEVQGRKTEEGVKNCLIKVTLVKLEDTATPNLRKALEGRGMLCHIPENVIAEQSLSKIENINDYCTGPLKEVLLQISLEKLYEVVVKNIGPLSMQYSQALGKINTTQSVTIPGKGK